MPLPDSDRPVDVLDTDFAAVLEANVDPIADAFVDDRGDADPAGLGQRLQPRGDIDAIAVDVVAFNDDIAKIDADSQHDGRLRALCIRRRSAGALHRKCAIHGVDHAAELDDRAIADQLHHAAVMGGDGRVENGFSMLFQAASVPASSASISRE